MKPFDTTARGFAWTVGRILAVVIVGAVLSWCGIGNADASEHANREEAYAACVAGRAAMQALPSYGSMRSGFDCTYRLSGSFHQYLCQGLAAATGAPMDCHQPPQGIIDVYFQSNVLCPPGEVWNDETNSCDAPNPCAAVTGTMYGAPAKVLGSETMCHNGCQYSQASPGGVDVCVGSGPTMYCGAEDWKATGQVCQPGDAPPSGHDPNKPVCQQLSADTRSCVYPNGDECAVSGSVVMCWKNGETGPRQTADGKTGADRSQAPNENQPPPNMNDPQANGSPGSSSVTNHTTNTTNNYTTQIYGGSGASGPGQSNVGDGGTDPGATAGESGSGGDGGGDGEGDGDGPGSPGAGLGDLYEGDGKTVADVVAAFKSRMEGAPIVTATTGFLSVSITGSCPVFTVPATEFWPDMTFDYHCSGELADALALGGYLVLAIAAFAAFRIAFY